MKVENLYSNNAKVITEVGTLQVLQHDKDLSLYTARDAINQYFMAEQNICKRQLVAKLQNSGVILQPKAMQWIAGSIKSVTDVKSVGDFIGKAIKGKVTGESTINPLYHGTGLVITEPTYKFLLLEEVNPQGLVVSDGAFYAAEDTVNLKVEAAKTLSGALLGGQGLFNLKLVGKGVAAIESIVPREELICVHLDGNDEARIDGNFALMWDGSLTLSVEKSGKSLIGSAVGGEGLVNVYRGTGRVWLTTPSAAI